MAKHIDIKFCGHISDVQDRGDLFLVTDSQDVQGVKESLGATRETKAFDGLFVKMHEGEYVEVYGFHGTIPDLNKPLYCIAEVWTEGKTEYRRDQTCKCRDRQ